VWAHEFDGPHNQWVIGQMVADPIPGSLYYASWPMRVYCLHSSVNTAVSLGEALTDALMPYTDQKTSNDGFTIGDWHAERVDVRPVGIVDASPVTGARREAYAVYVRLINVTR
jgi:hypothetical protein